MTAFDIEVLGWLGGAPTDEDPLERETLASVQINCDGIPLTEVDDNLAHTVRSHINVPAGYLARWLLINWWRLRWEPTPLEEPTQDWLNSHSLASITSDYAWPPITITSDGDFIRLQVHPSSDDVSTVRYLRSATLDVPAADFERAVDRLIETVRARMTTRLPEYEDLNELIEEWTLDRKSTARALTCKLQALAGMDPGTATESWLEHVQRLFRSLGGKAVEEILAVLPPKRGISAVEQTVAAMRASSVELRLSTALEAQAPPPRELPWQRGARLAALYRAKIGATHGPISRETLNALIAAKMPFPICWHIDSPFAGGYREHDKSTRVLMTAKHENGQRFYLARLIAAQLIAPESDRVLPISDAKTAAQKYQRAFAQEFLCPWVELEEFLRHRPLREEAIAAAADHFEVSQFVITTALMNRGRLPRRWAT